MNDFSEAFGRRLKEERDLKGLNQADFGAIGGVGKLAQLNYERGLRSPSAAYLGALLDYGVDVNYLISGARSVAIGEPGGAVVDASLLAGVLEQINKVAERKGFVLSAADTARIASIVYARLEARQATTPRDVREMASIVAGLWCDFRQGKFDRKLDRNSGQ